ncbi:CBS domain-containing protein [Caulobacter sp. NIBR2454]|uniref:CBS domain-containing protein n=1 Tax=Caulobacter sp. NIBR2454 TaxID=3015996 RepID=UPI0022B6FB7E|nr:CBS domain-containing protein [Caulobacter sp. NIBR2454]
MLVSQILKTKGAEVFAANQANTVAVAAALLHERRIGAVVILDDSGDVAGILSERDIVRLLAQEGGDALGRPVSSCMTRDVLFAKPSETIDSLLSRMTDRRIRHLPVVEGGKLAGIVSIGDLVKAKIAETEAEAEGLKAYIAAG